VTRTRPARSRRPSAPPSSDALAALEQRKPARRVAEVPPDVREALSRGWIASINLVELLAIDPARLFDSVLAELGVDDPQWSERYREFARQKILAQTRGAGIVLFDLSRARPDLAVFDRLSCHKSDTVRSWAAYLAGASPARSLKQRFEMLRPFADDPHMGVREYAWMALRPHVVADFDGALPRLIDWAKSGSGNVRRCAVEVSRPRGVWCEHFARLKQTPQEAEPLLETVRADPVRYVQNSVANWLNDASKTAPDWVRVLCGRWFRESKTAATGYIVSRALRTINK